MKPGLKNWSTTDWSTDPVTGDRIYYKSRISKAQVEDGFYTDLVLSPDQLNYFRWKYISNLRNASRLRLKNFSQNSVHGWVSANVYNDVAAYYVNGCGMRFLDTFNPENTNHVHVSRNQAGWNSDYFQSNARFFEAAAAKATPTAGFGFLDSVYGSDSAANQNAIVSMGLTSGPGFRSLFYMTLASASYTAWTTGTSTGHNWITGDCAISSSYSAPSEPWAFYNSTVPEIRSAVNVGAALTARAAVGLASTTTACMRHTRHGTGAEYYNSPQNPCALLLLDTPQIWRSLDNITWTRITPAWVPIIAQRRCLEYSVIGHRWGVICSNGVSSGGYPTFAYSDNNGDSWTEVSSAFGFNNLSSGAAGVTNMRLTTDHYGHWCAAFITEHVTNYPLGVATWHVEAFVSEDNGLTWERVYLPGESLFQKSSGGFNFRADIDTWFHDGSFYIALAGHNTWSGIADDPVVNIWSSLRIDDDLR